MKIALAQINYHIGNFEGNIVKMSNAIGQARKAGADLICFSELATCGYPPRDFLEFRDFIRMAGESIEKLKSLSDDIAIVLGSPSINPVVEGKDLYNSAYFLYGGEIVHIAHKALLPTYDIFDEYRYFEPSHQFQTVTFKGKKIAITICEDIWNVGNENPLYTTCPLDELIKEDPDFILNLSASPFHVGQAQTRIEILRENVARYGKSMFYVNHCGAQTQLIFDGGSLVVSPDGNVFDEAPYFKECILYYDLDEVDRGGVNRERQKNKMELVHDALVLGIRDYFQKLGFSRAIIGLSGGLDSALTTVLAVGALGAENVRVLLMPSEFSSDHSVDDSIQLAETLGIQYDIVPIQPSFEAFKTALSPFFQGLPFSVAEENIQARCRGILLMAMSNKFGHILLNTTNKSEMAVGYGTLYGDLCGGLSVIGDIYKTEVFELSRYINRLSEIIPRNIINKPPSAELRPDQKDTDSLPEYEILDEILYEYIEKRLGPEEIIANGFEAALVRRILKLVNISEFKRHQTAPVLRVSRKAFGMGRRMPIVGKYLN